MITLRGWTLVALSAALALAYGTFARDWALHEAPLWARASLKASAVALFALLAAIERGPRLLIAALALGAIGDALLALGDATMFQLGGGAFLIGHILYATLFLRAGIGLRAAASNPARLAAMLALIAAAIASTALLWPPDPATRAGYALYAIALTGMALAALTLPRARWPAIAGALVFFLSDVLLSIELHAPPSDPTLAALLGPAGWLCYWAGQAGIGLGILRAAERR